MGVVTDLSVFNTVKDSPLVLEAFRKRFYFYFLINFFFIHHITNLLLTEREGRTGEYWPEVVTVRKRGPYKNDRGPIFPGTARAS